MSLLNDASLVLVPSGYKEDVLYCQKPTDGSGDFTFSRASTATRVNSEGFIEKARTNFLLRSYEFGNAYWTPDGISVTADTIANPLDSSVNADTLTTTSSGSGVEFRLRANTSMGTSIVYSYSCYVKRIDYDYFYLRTLPNNAFSIFNINNGTISTQSGNHFDAQIESVGNGWYRCSVSFITPSSFVNNLVDLGFSFSSSTFSGSISSGRQMYVYGVQLEESLVATEYIPTTTAAVSVGMTADVPRLDYTNSSCPSLLLEPQRTNLLTQSEYLDSVFVPTNITQTTNYGTSPDGNLTSTRLELDNVTDSRTVETFTGIVTSGVTYTFSCYYKGVSGETTYMYFLDSNGITSVSKKITFTGEWQRESVTFVAGSASNYTYIVDVRQGTSTATDFEVWGGQVEEGSYPTSYIPTYGTSVTRVADACYKTGISSLIGQTEGTIFMDFVLDSVDGGNDFRFDITEGTSYDNEIFVGMTNGDLRALIRVSASNVYDSGSVSAVVGTRYKMALAYANNDVAFYVNGTQENTSSSATIPSTDEITIGNRTDSKEMVLKESLNQAILFKTRLSNTELAQLTSI